MKKKLTKATKNARVGVLGSGSFATAIVKMLLENCKTVQWCVRNEFVKGAIEQRGHNPTYLTTVAFNLKKLNITTDINELVSNCDVIILAVPSIYLAESMEKLTCDLEGKLFCSAIKGIVPKHNDIVAHYLRDNFKIGFKNQAVIALAMQKKLQWNVCLILRSLLQKMKMLKFSRRFCLPVI